MAKRSDKPSAKNNTGDSAPKAAAQGGRAKSAQASGKNPSGGGKSGATMSRAAAKAAATPSKVEQLKEFFGESWVEVKKVTWPTRKECITTGVAVVVLVIIMSLFLALVDMGLGKLVKYIIGN